MGCFQRLPVVDSPEDDAKRPDHHSGPRRLLRGRRRRNGRGRTHCEAPWSIIDRGRSSPCEVSRITCNDRVRDKQRRTSAFTGCIGSHGRCMRGATLP
jgi:hypothetical protein